MYTIQIKKLNISLTALCNKHYSYKQGQSVNFKFSKTKLIQDRS